MGERNGDRRAHSWAAVGWAKAPLGRQWLVQTCHQGIERFLPPVQSRQRIGAVYGREIVFILLRIFWAEAAMTPRPGACPQRKAMHADSSPKTTSPEACQ